MPENQIMLPVRAQDAIMLFRRFGVDVTGMSREAIKAVRRDLLHRYHPDRGGDLDSAQVINAAYDLLKDGVPDEMFYRTDLDLYEAHKAKNPGFPEWAWAGYSGGIPDATIYRNDFSDVNFIKKSMWELSGQSRAEYIIWGFDGRRFHGISVFGSPKIFSFMTTAIMTWLSKHAHQCRAVLVGTGKTRELYATYADGKYLTDQPIRIEHSSFNSNPGNDPNFARRLAEALGASRCLCE
jgi:curved DNA-binding protein CbpA